MSCAIVLWYVMYMRALVWVHVRMTIVLRHRFAYA